MDNVRYAEEDNADFEEQMTQHIRELRFRIECMWRQYDECVSHPNGRKLATRLEPDIRVCENHLRRLENNCSEVLA